MEVQGKIIAALDKKTGSNSRGDWVVQEFVLETPGVYPRKMVFSVYGADRLQRFNIQEGQEVSVSFDIDAHEYNGRWFNSIRAYDVRPVSAPVAGSVPASGGGAIDSTPFGGAPAVSSNPFSGGAENNPVDDLPF